MHHVSRSQEIIIAMLLTWLNIHYFQELMQSMRDAIEVDQFAEFQTRFHADRAQGDIEPL